MKTVLHTKRYPLKNPDGLDLFKILFDLYLKNYKLM